MLSRVSRRLLTRALRPAVVANIDVSSLDADQPLPLRFFAFQHEQECVKKEKPYQHEGKLDSLERLEAIRIQLQKAFSDEQVKRTIENAADVPSNCSLIELLKPMEVLPPGELRQTYEFNRPKNIPSVSYAKLGQQLYESSSSLREEWQPHAAVYHRVALTCC
ncbi:hypothetical protein THRCLA_09155 [Thraustotheca clavata]|uniref:Uncharacterized protein n=1 Tax=Thraustotheca clavata TaxID=74557 RepID=A0A1V9YZC5_9STRA|nr:hypothetical protein THRCLA_09155 [Thraustotheca clavata]